MESSNLMVRISQSLIEVGLLLYVQVALLLLILIIFFVIVSRLGKAVEQLKQMNQWLRGIYLTTYPEKIHWNDTDTKAPECPRCNQALIVRSPLCPYCLLVLKW